MSNGSESDAGPSQVVTRGTVDGWGGLTKVAARFARNRRALVGLIVLGLFVLVTVLELLLGGDHGQKYLGSRAKSLGHPASSERCASPRHRRRWVR
jgi:hypothetical protein